MACFCGAYKVKSLGNLSGWDVSHVTNMQQMFDENTYDSPALESLDGINKWNVSNVQNILCLFRNDTNLKDIDISGWDLSKKQREVGRLDKCLPALLMLARQLLILIM